MKNDQQPEKEFGENLGARGLGVRLIKRTQGRNASRCGGKCAEGEREMTHLYNGGDTCSEGG